MGLLLSYGYANKPHLEKIIRMSNTQRILVVPRPSLPEPLQTISNIEELVNKFGKWLQRDFAENDEDFLQIIPYILITRTVEFYGTQYFCYKRKKAGTEERLHNNYSLGVGGHVDWNDWDPTLSLWDAVEAGAWRELAEEVRLDSVPTLERFSTNLTTDLIYDSSNAVGRVHLGIPYICNSSNVLVKEIDKLEGLFMTLEEIKTIEDRLEGWSKTLLGYIENDSRTSRANV